MTSLFRYKFTLSSYIIVCSLPFRQPGDESENQARRLHPETTQLSNLIPVRGTGNLSLRGCFVSSSDKYFTQQQYSSVYTFYVRLQRGATVDFMCKIKYRQLPRKASNHGWLVSADLTSGVQQEYIHICVSMFPE